MYGSFVSISLCLLCINFTPSSQVQLKFYPCNASACSVISHQIKTKQFLWLDSVHNSTFSVLSPGQHFWDRSSRLYATAHLWREYYSDGDPAKFSVLRRRWGQASRHWPELPNLFLYTFTAVYPSSLLNIWFLKNDPYWIVNTEVRSCHLLQLVPSVISFSLVPRLTIK